MSTCTDLSFLLVSFTGRLGCDLLYCEAFIVIEPSIIKDICCAWPFSRLKGQHALDECLELLTEEAWLIRFVSFPELLDAIATLGKMPIPSVIFAGRSEGHVACSHCEKDDS